MGADRAALEANCLEKQKDTFKGVFLWARRDSNPRPHGCEVYWPFWLLKGAWLGIYQNNAPPLEQQCVYMK